MLPRQLPGPGHRLLQMRNVAFHLRPRKNPRAKLQKVHFERQKGMERYNALCAGAAIGYQFIPSNPTPPRFHLN